MAFATQKKEHRPLTEWARAHDTGVSVSGKSSFYFSERKINTNARATGAESM